MFDIHNTDTGEEVTVYAATSNPNWGVGFIAYSKEHGWYTLHSKGWVPVDKITHTVDPMYATDFDKGGLQETTDWASAFLQDIPMNEGGVGSEMAAESELVISRAGGRVPHIGEDRFEDLLENFFEWALKWANKAPDYQEQQERKRHFHTMLNFYETSGNLSKPDTYAWVCLFDRRLNTQAGNF